MKIIFLNGPPGCGKDYAGHILWEWFGHAQVFKFAGTLKERAHAFYEQCDEAGHPLPHDAFEHVKDTPLDQFEGKTPREVYIGVSELFVKPMHGDKQFGVWLADKIQRLRPEVAVITDSGFRGEAEVLVERFGAENCLLARIHREGYDFSSDSRSYIDLADLGVQCLDINNDGGDGFRSSLGTLFPSSRA